jgi:hypothetical protein
MAELQGKSPSSLNVSVALNGQQFTADPLVLFSYRDPEMLTLQPQSGPQRGGQSVYITVRSSTSSSYSDLPLAPQIAALLRVRFGDTPQSPISVATPLNSTTLVTVTPQSLPNQIVAVLFVSLDSRRFTDLRGKTFTYYGALGLPRFN